MVYRTVPFSMTLSDHLPKFRGHEVTIDALDLLCAQLTRDLLAIAKFLSIVQLQKSTIEHPVKDYYIK